MSDLKTFLKEMISLPGLSGYEDPVRDLIAAHWRPLVTELSVSKLGSLHGLKRGSAPDPRPRILLAAHMDAIGMMVTRVTPDGLIFFTEIGGVDPRILPATPVIVHGRSALPGIIAQPPDKFLPPAARGNPVAMGSLFVDTGLPGVEVSRLVRVGDLISFATEPMELPTDLIAGHSLDNRASVAAVTACLEELSKIEHAWDVYAVATAQEEETLAGGFTSPYIIRPAIAVAVDVTFAKGPGVSDYRGRSLGKGVSLGWGPNTHPFIFESFKSLAERIDMPFETEVYPRYSGTDAMGMQIVAEGIPSMVLSIPLRYMHTPVEIISLKDVQRTGRLLAQFIAGLTPDFVDKIRWEEAK
jgi:putative aminopeptidase FrvX